MTDSSTPDADQDGADQDGADQGSSYFSDDAATFGDRVAAARRAAGLSQESLCRKLGIKLKTLRSWEDDISEPRANKLQMLAGVLNVSLVWLLTGDGHGVPDPDMSDLPQIEGGADVLADLRSIRAEYKILGERMLRLEKRLGGILKQQG